MKYITLSPRDGDTGEFPLLGIAFSFDESGRVVVSYPGDMPFSKRKGAGTRKGERRHQRLEAREQED